MERETGFTVQVHGTVQERTGYWAATVNNLPIVAYGNSEAEAKDRAMRAVVLLCKRHAVSVSTLSAYLGRRGIEFEVTTEHQATQQSYSGKVAVLVGA